MMAMMGAEIYKHKPEDYRRFADLQKKSPKCYLKHRKTKQHPKKANAKKGEILI